MQAYQKALASSKSAQKNYLEAITQMERQNNIMQGYFKFIIPAQFRIDFSSLPNEILLRIIQHCPPLEQSKFALINHHCRDLVYSSPSLWTYISMVAMSKKQIERHLVMSQPLMLHVDAHAVETHDLGEALEKADLCSRFHSRWHNVSLDSSLLRHFRPGADSDSSLTSVRLLELPRYTTIFDEVEVEVAQDRLKLDSFLEAWKFASLTTLIIHECIPPSGSFASIETLRIGWDYPLAVHNIFQQLRSFVETLPILRHLEIQMDFTKPENQYDNMWTRGDIHLNHLQSLTISVKIPTDLDMPVCSQHTSKSAVSYFVSSLVMPNVEKIDLGFFGHGPNPIDTFDAESLFPKNRTFKGVKDFHLRINPISRRGNVYIYKLSHSIYKFREKFTALETFTLHLPSETFEDASDRGKLKGPSSDFLRLQAAVSEYANYTWPEDKEELYRWIDPEETCIFSDEDKYGIRAFSEPAELGWRITGASFNICPL